MWPTRHPEHGEISPIFPGISAAEGINLFPNKVACSRNLRFGGPDPDCPQNADKLNQMLFNANEGAQAFGLQTEPSVNTDVAIATGAENVSGFAPELLQAAEAVKKRETAHRVTVRTLLSWFQAQRRGSF